MREYERRRERYGSGENERRKAMQRNRKKRARNRRVFAFFFLVLIIVSALIIVSRTPLFDVKTIEISGHGVVAEEDILNICGLEEGENIFSYREKKMKEKILALPYVSDVEIQKKYPSGISIVIREEKEFAVFEFAERYVACDRFGKSIRALTADECEGLIVVKGCEENDFEMGDYISIADEEKGKTAIKCLSLIEDYGFSNVTEIDVSDIVNILFVVNGNLKVKIGELGEEDEMSYKMAYIKEVMNKLPDNISGIIDARNIEAGISYRAEEFLYEEESENATEDNDDEISEEEEYTEEENNGSELAAYSVDVENDEEGTENT